MKMQMAGRYITLTAETEAEQDGLGAIAEQMRGRRLQVGSIDRNCVTLRPGGSGGEDRIKPVNITFDTTPMPLRLISNLAETPFELNGQRYASIEGFWQGLKFPGDADRQRLAALSGHAAKSAGPTAAPGDRIIYQEEVVYVGTADHWALMERACNAKFDQHEPARTALLSTSDQPLAHKVSPDSRTIPGLIMADIWTRIRARLATT